VLDGLVSFHKSSSGVSGRRGIDVLMPWVVVVHFASVKEEGSALNLVRLVDF